MTIKDMAYSLEYYIKLIHKMKSKLLTAIFLLIILFPVSAQKKWTLIDCIDYALINNISLQRQKLQTEINQANLTRSKMNMLPDLNFGTDARVGFGRSINPVTNLITFKQNISNSYSLSSNISIFNGFATLNTIAANKFMLQAGIEAEKVTKNTLIVNILGSYYQVLYAKGLEDAAKMQQDLSEKQLFRIQKTVETGREALSRLYEMESRFSEDKLAFTVARNNTDQALTSLKQLLQIEAGTGFEILMPDLNNLVISELKFNPDSIFNIASQVLPRLKAINFELLAAKKQLSAAKGVIAPRLSMGGAIYTGYYKVVAEGVIEQDSYADQMKNNNSQAVYLSLEIPIFNKYTTARNIRLARINRNDTELRLELEKNSLYSEIETACLNINRGQDEFSAALATLDFNKKSFDAVEKKFESGLVDVTDYSDAKTRLFRADTEVLRTRLQMLIRMLTINLYTTGDYERLKEQTTK
jgi:outer membrane protein